jgi:hypothetical protein
MCLLSRGQTGPSIAAVATTRTKQSERAENDHHPNLIPLCGGLSRRPPQLQEPPMDAKKKYTIEFLYTDNNQLYQEDVELTDDEHKRVKTFLTKLEHSGSIELTVEGGSVIYPYCEPAFIGFEELKANWTAGTLLDWGKIDGFHL